MGKLAALLAVLAFAVFGIQQTGGTSRTLFGVQSSATDEMAEVVARSAALAGYTRVENALTESFEDVAVSGTFDGATYTASASVSATDGTARISAFGVLDRAFVRPDSFEIHALVVPLADPEELPEFLSYGMLVGGDLSISGSSEIVRMGFTGSDASEYNPLVHTNGNLRIGSASTRVTGFGSYSGALTGRPGTGTFVPHYNPDGLPPLSREDPIEIPPFDADAIAAAYGVTVDYPALLGEYWTIQLRSDMLPGGVLPGGPRDEPAVYRIHGNAQLNDIVVDGYAIFVADGRTEINGTLTAINGDPAYPNQSQVAIYTGGELTMNGGAQAHAQIVAQGGLSFRGNVDIYGSLVTHSDFSNGGGATIHTRPASPALSRPWQEHTPGIGVLAYTEFDENAQRRQ